MHAGFFHPPGHRERAQPLAAVAPLRAEPLRALLDDLAHPVHGLHVVLERRSAEEADLRNVRRPKARHAALAFDRFDHRGLFAAYIGARTASQVHRRQSAGGLGLQLRELGLQNLTTPGVLVAQIDPDLADARAPGRDQHALEKAVRIALEVPAVLERAGLALIDVHRHYARFGLGCDEAPFASRRKAGAAKAAQARVFHQLRHRIARALPREAVSDELVAALLLVLGIVGGL